MKKYLYLLIYIKLFLLTKINDKSYYLDLLIDNEFTQTKANLVNIYLKLRYHYNNYQYLAIKCAAKHLVKTKDSKFAHFLLMKNILKFDKNDILTNKIKNIKYKKKELITLSIKKCLLTNNSDIIDHINYNFYIAFLLKNNPIIYNDTTAINFISDFRDFYLNEYIYSSIKLQKIDHSKINKNIKFKTLTKINDFNKYIVNNKRDNTSYLVLLDYMYNFKLLCSKFYDIEHGMDSNILNYEAEEDKKFTLQYLNNKKIKNVGLLKKIFTNKILNYFNYNINNNENGNIFDNQNNNNYNNDNNIFNNNNNNRINNNEDYLEYLNAQKDKVDYNFSLIIRD